MSTQHLIDKHVKEALSRLLQQGKFIRIHGHYIKFTEEMAAYIDIDHPDAPQAVIEHLKQRLGKRRILTDSEVFAAITKNPDMPNNIVRHELGAAIAAKAKANGMTTKAYANGVKLS